MDDFTEYRDAARAGIIAAGGEPILVEDFPSLMVSSRTACLDGIASSDAVVVIVGSRGGWVAPSGKIVVEEEYEEARRRKIPVIPFIQSVKTREEKAEALVNRLSHYIDGHFRTTFDTPAELQALVSNALESVIEHGRAPMNDMTAITDLLSVAPKMGNEVVLRFVLMPQRSETLIDSIEIASDKFRHDLLTLGHSQEVELLSYEKSKNVETGISDISIKQAVKEIRREARDKVNITITTTGTITIDTNVTGRQPFSAMSENSFGTLFTLQESDVTGRLIPSFAFANGIYQMQDAFKRFDRFVYNIVLHNVGQRILRGEIPKGNSQTMPQTISVPVVAFDNPQVLSRDDLGDPTTQIEAILSLLRRRIVPRDMMGRAL